MDRVIEFVCVMLPASPLTTRGYVPTVTVDAVVTVRIALPLGTSGFGSKEAFAPVGNPKTLSVTGEVNPLVAVSRVV